MSKNCTPCNEKFKTMIGGQALIEGIMKQHSNVNIQLDAANVHSLAGKKEQCKNENRT